MIQQPSKADLLEERLVEFAATIINFSWQRIQLVVLVEFAATIINFSVRLPRTSQGRHIATQILRSGTAPAPNYGEARGAESRADFVHKLRIVEKELNETAVWLRIISRTSLVPRL